MTSAADVPAAAGQGVEPPGQGAEVPPDRDRPQPGRGWWPVWWYPSAIPVVYVVAVWSASMIHPGWLVRPIVVAVAAVLLLTLLLSWILGDRHRGALAAAGLTLAMLLSDDPARNGLLLVTALIVGEGLLRRGRPWRHGPRITRFMSVLAATLLVVSAVGTVQQGSIQGAVADVQADLNARPADAFDPGAPDIYVILLDGYPGDDAAALDPTFDANAFPAALADRGFEVERHARSNYLTTRLTLATMLADQHVDDAPELDPPFGNNAVDARRLRLLGDDGLVYRTLREAGYETVTLTSPAAHIGLRRVDRVIDPPGPSEFESVLLGSTALGSIVDGIAPDFFAGIARDQIVSTFSAAEAVAAEPHARPRFVWVHVLAPHPPFLFRADGSPVKNAPVLEDAPDRSVPGWRDTRIRQTFEYATFVANRTTSLLDGMAASVEPDSVIVILSDHGSETGFDAARPLASDLDERSSILLAVRAPGHPGLLPPGTTPIGVLPRVLNAYLGSALPLRSDTIWAWRDNGSLLDEVRIDPGALDD